MKAIESTGGDTTPAKLIEALSNITPDTPGGSVTLKPCEDAFVGTRDFVILESKQLDDRITWVPVHTYEQVFLADYSTAQ